MKAKLILIFALFGLTAVGFASLTTEQKEAELVAEVERQQKLWDVGVISSNDDDFVRAKLALFTFRRDTAGNVQEKIAQQEKIVQCLAGVAEWKEAMYKAGVIIESEVRRAKAPLLEAQKMLEELKSKQKK